jgi:hypothetical protein
MYEYPLIPQLLQDGCDDVVGVIVGVIDGVGVTVLVGVTVGVGVGQTIELDPKHLSQLRYSLSDIVVY